MEAVTRATPVERLQRDAVGASHTVESEPALLARPRRPSAAAETLGQNDTGGPAQASQRTESTPRPATVRQVGPLDDDSAQANVPDFATVVSGGVERTLHAAPNERAPLAQLAHSRPVRDAIARRAAGPNRAPSVSAERVASRPLVGQRSLLTSTGANGQVAGHALAQPAPAAVAPAADAFGAADVRPRPIVSRVPGHSGGIPGDNARPVGDRPFVREGLPSVQPLALKGATRIQRVDQSAAVDDADESDDRPDRRTNAVLQSRAVDGAAQATLLTGSGAQGTVAGAAFARTAQREEADHAPVAAASPPAQTPTASGSSAPAAVLGDRELEDLLDRLFPRLRVRLSRELLVARERAGLLTDLH
jgi:hypothetical protein